MTTSNPAIITHGLGRRFGRHWVLAHVDLQVERGEAVLLAGANGSGKTTLLRIFAGLLRSSIGSVEVMGLDPRRDGDACRPLLSLISHNNYLYEGLTAVETLRLWAQILGQPHADQQLLELLEMVGLQDSAHHDVRGFSAGMRKRLTLLRAQIERPAVLLLDEPFAALDPAGQQLVVEWLRSFRAEGRTIVVASHALGVASELAERALLLRGGQVLWGGPAANVAAAFAESQR